MRFNRNISLLMMQYMFLWQLIHQIQINSKNISVWRKIFITASINLLSMNPIGEYSQASQILHIRKLPFPGPKSRRLSPLHYRRAPLDLAYKFRSQAASHVFQDAKTKETAYPCFLNSGQILNKWIYPRSLDWIENLRFHRLASFCCVNVRLDRRIW